jgi:hypothetical protein
MDFSKDGAQAAYFKAQSVQRCKHLYLGYKNQSVYAVSGTSSCSHYT